jgi:hypothetical protein
MDMDNWPHIKKSARRKKRLVKKDFDKQLIRLSKRRQLLSDQIRSLPPVILKQPYQKGWVRLFVLRADVALTDKAGLYQTVLDKINTVCWHYDRSFKKRKTRKGRYQHFDAKYQKLREPDDYEFHGPALNLSEGEKRCFYLKKEWSIKLHRRQISYVFAEPWRFELVVRPHIVYTARQIDEVLEQEKSEIDKYIDWNCYLPRIWKLKGGAYRFCSSYHFEAPRYENELKNKPMYPSKDEYMDY